MSTFRNPVGPQPAKVYWRRRAVLLLVLLAIIAVVVLIVVRPGAGATGAAPSPAPSSSAPAPSGTTPSSGPVDPADAEACDPSRVTVEATTDAVSYDPGVNPVLSFSLTSTMTVPCTLSAGSDVQEFRVTSGEELIWSSKDCQTEPQAATVLLMPGVPKAGSTLPWDRTRSSAETCDVPGEPVIAGGASYHLEVSVGEIESKDSSQFLLY
ncbi:MAG TPA: hypothetical protein VN200_11165 [Rhodoglobus sp.]|nr:hypothetical protein [Rhodoglobus sp.]